MSEPNLQKENTAAPPGGDFDAVVVGAGFAGLYMLHRLRGMGLTARVFEAGSGVGGTWQWNRYPGARCDVESLEYSYQFSDELQQEWVWTERYASQPEILRYVNHVADRFDLRRDIGFDTRVTSATFDEAEGRWVVETDDGLRVTATYCVMATGCLSSANTPGYDGLDRFKADTYHTGNWPHEAVDLEGKRIGIIGTGSSAVQAIPIIARQAAHLHVFQRTPNYVVPARNAPLEDHVQQAFKDNYAALREKAKQTRNGLLTPPNPASALEVSEEERQREFRARWEKGGLSFLGVFSDIMLDRHANDPTAAFVRAKIREIVNDPAVAARLSPRSIFGCKRLCIDTGYFETFNRPNVTLVDISQTPIERITEDGLRVDGDAYRLDAIVFATGFDAMTGALNKIDIRGIAGRTLKDKWRDGPRTYLGLATAGFPNLFTITGPGSPSVLTNMLPSIEQHVEWITDCLSFMRARDLVRIEPLPEAEEAWVSHVNLVADRTLFPSCNSWYLGANIPGKARVFMPYIGFPAYVQKCEEVVRNGYEGFKLS